MLPRVAHQLARTVGATRPVSSSVSPQSLFSLCARRALHSVSSASAPQLHPTRTKLTVTGVAIEQVTTTDDDSTLTLGDMARRHSASYESIFASTKISDVLSSKAKYGATLHTVKGTDSVASAMQAMAHFDIGAILVAEPNDPATIIGIFSTRDFVKRIDEEWKPIDVKATQVQELMSHNPVFAYSDTTAMDAMTMMNEGGFRHLPVRDRATNKTIGLISIGDLVRTMMRVFKEKNEYLEDFTSGRYPA